MRYGCKIAAMGSASRWLVVCTLGLGGCASHLTIYPRDGGNLGSGVAHASGERVTISLKEKTYTGTYVLSSSYSWWVPGFRDTTGYFSELNGSNGRLFATAKDGDSIRCEYLYDGISGVGTCEDKAGNMYDIIIKN